MKGDQFSDWLSKATAAQILGCSEKTIERLATQKKIQKVMLRIPGRRSTPVYHPGDVETLRSASARLEPFPVASPAAPRGKAAALVPAGPSGRSAGDMFLQLLTSGIPRPSIGPRHKLFLTLKEAAEYSGMSRGWLLSKIKDGELAAIKVGGWKIRRSDLEQL